MIGRIPVAVLEDSPVVSVTLEPRLGHSDEEVVAALHKLGATRIRVLSPGFISAKATLKSLPDVEPIARVHLEARKEMH